MIGVVGGGQLARMLVQAAASRQIPVAVQTGSDDDPAVEGASRLVTADPRDVAGTRQLVEGCSGITFENEWVNIDALIPLEQQGVRFRPSLAALSPLVDKLSQRQLLADLLIPSPPWCPLSLVSPAQPALPQGWSFPAFRWLYAENGLVNGWLVAWFGDTFSPIGFLTTPQLALPAVMLVTLWKGLGYYMVIFLAGLQGIPKELYEAAELDGSEGWRQHLDITLPLLRPYVALVAVVSSIAATKVFEEVYLMTQGGPADSTRTMVYYVYDQAFAELEISYACTLGLALFLLVMLFTLIRLAFSGDRALI